MTVEQFLMQVDPSSNLQVLSVLVTEWTGEEGPFRYVFRGQVCASWRLLGELEVQPGETLFYVRELIAPPTMAVHPSMPVVDPMRDMMDNPVMQLMMDHPDLMMTMMDSNPQIRAMRERRPEINALFNDPQVNKL